MDISSAMLLSDTSLVIPSKESKCTFVQDEQRVLLMDISNRGGNQA